MSNKKHLADSSDHLEAEKIILDLFSKEFKRAIVKVAKYFDGDIKVEIDGYAKDPLTLIEIWAHIGKPKSAQIKKVIADALKLIFIERKIGVAEKYLVFIDEEAIKPFLKASKSWYSKALDEFGVQPKLIKIESRLRERILAAQLRNKNGNHVKT